MVRALGAQLRQVWPQRRQEISRPDLLLVSDLKPALRRPGCPLCRLLREADLRYIKTFLHEGKDDGRMLLRLLTTWGLCARHASGLVRLEPAECGDGLGTGSLYDWLLDHARRLLEDLRRAIETAIDAGSSGRPRRNARKRADKVLGRLTRSAGCPACESQGWYAGYITEGFLRVIEPAAGLPEIRELYRRSDGLCLPHWRAIRALQASPSVRELMTAKQRETLASLKAALGADLARSVKETVREERPRQEAAYARALAIATGDTAWQPPEE